MRCRNVERPAGAFQEAVPEAVLARVCRRAFGSAYVVESVTELPWGTYNTTYRVEPRSGPPVVLRVAPRRERAFAVEAGLMRNEYAAVPYLAPVSDLVPRVLFADFTHQLLDRDYLFQSVLPGVPAPEGLGRHPRTTWGGFFRQLGVIARRIHDVPGAAFGPVAGPGFATWSEVVVSYFRTAADDVHAAGHDADDLRGLAAEAERHAAVLDEGTEPRLLHGDGWTANVLVDPDSADLTVTGICDWDRAEWGDPMADWAIQRALLRPGTERDAFWVGYDQARPEVGIRQRFYQARHVVGLRLDRIRLGRFDRAADTYGEIGEILGWLRRCTS